MVHHCMAPRIEPPCKLTPHALPGRPALLGRLGVVLRLMCRLRLETGGAVWDCICTRSHDLGEVCDAT